MNIFSVIKGKKCIFTIIFILFASVVASAYYFSETTIHIIRHGEKVIAKGISDAPLTDIGKLQAKELGKYLASNNRIAALYASPMRRARETAQIIASYTASRIIFDERLTEKNYRKSDELYSDGTNIYVKFLPNGEKETKVQHLNRLLKFFQDKVSPWNKEIYIVAHGGLINRIFEKIAQDTNREVAKYKVNYCSTFTFKYNKVTQTFKYISHDDISGINNKSVKNV